ncbi:MAG: carboxypeptidase regulatory-like domain-containing protein, partial [Crenarchaeota archaeon]|nr:carboxypeptidase regulatory-like domain-containing protein [Thermoproteota archaeon]
TYGVVFNIGNNTVSSLPVQPIYEVLILCPSRTLTLTVLDYNRVAIPSARIEMFEVTSGLFYGAVTDNSGAVAVEVTFGKYRLRVYSDNILLNETVIEVFSDTQREIRCGLYNIQVWVTVVDYFAQPIPNVNVLLNGPEIGTRSATTQTDGTATFSNVIGGNMQIIAYPAGMENSYEAVNLQIEEPTAIQIKMAKYILIGPFLIESTVLATFIVIFAAVLLFLSLEIYRRKRVKPTDRES